MEDHRGEDARADHTLRLLGGTLQAVHYDRV